jgi:hypothetical protein
VDWRADPIPGVSSLTAVANHQSKTTPLHTHNTQCTTHRPSRATNASWCRPRGGAPQRRRPAGGASRRKSWRWTRRPTTGTRPAAAASPGPAPVHAATSGRAAVGCRPWQRRRQQRGGDKGKGQDRGSCKDRRRPLSSAIVPREGGSASPPSSSAAAPPPRAAASYGGPCTPSSPPSTSTGSSNGSRSDGGGSLPLPLTATCPCERRLCGWRGRRPRPSVRATAGTASSRASRRTGGWRRIWGRRGWVGVGGGGERAGRCLASFAGEGRSWGC